MNGEPVKTALITGGNCGIRYARRFHRENLSASIDELEEFRRHQ